MQKITKHIVLALFSLLSFQLSAQQLPLYSQYCFNRFGFNPAYAGNKNRVEAVITHRNHLMNFPGAPTTQLFTVSAPWQKKYVGLGLRVENDKIGISNNFTANLAGNYFIGFGKGKLAMGLELGVAQHKVNWNELVVSDNGDDILPTSSLSVIVPNGAFGLFYTTEKIYAGYSVQNLITSKISYQGPELDNAAHQYSHQYINVGGVIKVSEKFQLEPFSLIKIVKNSPWQVDVGTYGVFKNAYGAGITYRTGDALVISAKVEIKEMIYIGYSYEIRVNSLAQYSSSSQEIMLGYYYKLLEPARKKIIHPRYYF